VGIRPHLTEHPTPFSQHSITHTIFIINFTNLPINFSQAKIFGIQKFDHSQLAGFSIFVLISRQNDELINKE
jgi:hypothetical protein